MSFLMNRCPCRNNSNLAGLEMCPFIHSQYSPFPGAKQHDKVISNKKLKSHPEGSSIENTNQNSENVYDRDRIVLGERVT